MVCRASASRTTVWLVRMHPSNQRCCWVVQSWTFTKICEWIDPAYSANLLAQAYDALKERWLPLKYATLLCISKLSFFRFQIWTSKIQTLSFIMPIRLMHWVGGTNRPCLFYISHYESCSGPKIWNIQLSCVLLQPSRRSQMLASNHGALWGMCKWPIDNVVLFLVSITLKPKPGVCPWACAQSIDFTSKKLLLRKNMTNWYRTYKSELIELPTAVLQMQLCNINNFFHIHVYN